MFMRTLRAPKEHESPFARFARRFLSDRLGTTFLVFLLVLIAVGLLAPLLSPYDPDAQDLGSAFAPSSAAHLLGTDEVGRDYLSRMLHAIRPTLLAGVLATALSLLIGLPTGLAAGYFRGAIDATLSRVTDAIMAIPSLLFALALVAILGPGIRTVILAIGVANAPRFFRVARSIALVIRQETYIEASRSLGISHSRILRTHVLPNMASPLIVQISMTIGFSILFEAGLSFLGLGVQAPEASWGSMLRNATAYASENIGLVLWPGLAILVVVLAFNTVGDSVRDSLGREQRKF
jgi:peptide/nickel transport system permease protein